jgi:hypothetical protein
MPLTDEELVRQLESVPLVEPPDFREAVMSRVKAHRTVVKFRPARARLYLGLAWAAAVAIVIGVAFFRAPEPRQQNAAATMTNPSPEISVQRTGDRFIVQPSEQGAIEWDTTKLTKVDTLPDGGIVLQRNQGATGIADIRLRVPGREVAKTSIQLP